MDLIGWSWLFLIVYVGLMLFLGIVGSRRVHGADDFATARGAYGPVFLAFAFAATTASGATFVGFPGIGYEAGTAAIWSVLLYPAGVYIGVLICMRVVSNSGNLLGIRSMPEFLGVRYRSDAVRVLVSLFSILLFFYLAGQLVSGIVMFQVMLGLSAEWALAITAVVLLVYVVLGGAHADILTDGVQGLLMVAIGILVVVLFVMGAGIDGGLPGLLDNLEAQDPDLVGWLNTGNVLYHSWWSVLAILLAHVPIGMLPHIGNKLWALKSPGDRTRFIVLASAFGLILGMLGLGGILARGVFGPGIDGNESLILLFIELFPTWVAALLGIGILAAVMSTADGLVVSSSQIVANDIYRLTIVPRFRPRLDTGTVDRHVLNISRVATVVVMLICTGMAWAMMDTNVAMIVWIGNGGMMAAIAGPLLLGAVWRGVTKAGAFAGLLAGVIAFVVLHSAVIDPAWFESPLLYTVATWLDREAPNPWSCAAMGEIASVLATVVVSKLSQPLPQAHLESIFSTQAEVQDHAQ